MGQVSKLSSSFFTDLPTELLCHIFVFAARSEQFDKNGELDDSRQLAASLAISQVCTYWRHVALGTGLLWTRIDVLKQSRIEFHKQLLERSRGCVVDLSIIKSSGSSSAWFVNVIECLEPSAERIGSFALEVTDDHELSRGVQWIFAESHPIPLHTLKLSTGSQTAIPLLYAKLARLTERAPNLKHIDLHRMRYPWENPPVGLLSLKLNELHRDIHATPEQMENVLRSCPLLETLEIAYSGRGFSNREDTYSYSSTSPPIHLRSLHTLSLENMHPDRIAHVLSRISTPVLRVIIIISEPNRPWRTNHGERHVLASFFIQQAKEQPNQRSTVEELSLGNLRIPRKDLAALFDALEELDTLSVRRCNVLDVLAPSLSERLRHCLAPRAPCCPKLRRLDFNDTSDVTVRSLKELVHARLVLSAIGLSKSIILLNVDEIEDAEDSTRNSDRKWLEANVADFYW